MASASASASANMVIKGGYYASWAGLNPSTINTQLFTHIYYAFINPNNNTFIFNIDPDQARNLVNFNQTLHTKKPPVKTLFSVGGASQNENEMFTRMASNSSSRKLFISSSIEVARKYGFDGIDLDWEFPNTVTAMDNMRHLLDEWRIKVQNEANSTGRKPLLLTAAVLHSNVITFDGPNRAYPSASISKNLDWINVMTYDYSGWNTRITGANAALYDPNGNGISTSKGLQSWIDSGVPKSKVIMGLPLYGKTWKLVNPAVHGIGAPASGVGPGNGTLTYAEIVQFNAGHNAMVVYDKPTVSTYSVAGDSWVGYDNTETVNNKVQFARRLGIGGYFFWALHGDYQWQISTTASAGWKYVHSLL